MMETLGGGRFVKGIICVAFYGAFLAGLRYFMAVFRIFWHFVANNWSLYFLGCQHQL